MFTLLMALLRQNVAFTKYTKQSYKIGLAILDNKFHEQTKTYNVLVRLPCLCLSGNIHTISFSFKNFCTCCSDQNGDSKDLNRRSLKITLKLRSSVLVLPNLFCTAAVSLYSRVTFINSSTSQSPRAKRYLVWLLLFFFRLQQYFLFSPNLAVQTMYFLFTLALTCPVYVNGNSDTRRKRWCFHQQCGCSLSPKPIGSTPHKYIQLHNVTFHFKKRLSDFIKRKQMLT